MQYKLCNFSLFDDLQGYDGGILSVGQWVAVDYDKKFYIGKITAIELLILDSQEEMVDITYLSKSKNGKYKWPKRKDTDIVSPDLIFCTKPRLREEGLEFCLENEDFITKQFQNYKNDLNE